MYFTWNVDNTNVFVFEKLLVEICWNMVGIHNYHCRSHEEMYRKAYRSNNSKVSSITILHTVVLKSYFTSLRVILLINL